MGIALRQEYMSYHCHPYCLSVCSNLWKKPSDKKTCHITVTPVSVSVVIYGDSTRVGTCRITVTPTVPVSVVTYGVSSLAGIHVI